MTTELDPRLQALFEQAEQTFDSERFLGDVMRRVDRQRYRAMLLWSLFGLVVLIGFAFVASPVFAAVNFVSQFLPMSVVEVETEWLQMLVSPVNSIAAAIAVGGLLIVKFFRWVLR
ncbi:MAG: hypothetical protein QNI98_03155 [Woeseiaceae bacterium]|nr:hypothetical protein [Woeseiaceae bacterium]